MLVEILPFEFSIQGFDDVFLVRGGEKDAPEKPSGPVNVIRGS